MKRIEAYECKCGKIFRSSVGAMLCFRSHCPHDNSLYELTKKKERGYELKWIYTQCDTVRTGKISTSSFRVCMGEMFETRATEITVEKRTQQTVREMREEQFAPPKPKRKLPAHMVDEDW